MSQSDDGKPGAMERILPVSDQAETERPEPHKTPLRVVIVEDEAIISMELEMLLEDLSAEVVGIAMSAKEAEALVALHKPDLLTMDINIHGDRDGVVAARDIFQEYGIRSIFVSAYSDAATRARAEPANPLGWVKKPVDVQELELVLREVRGNKS